MIDTEALIAGREGQTCEFKESLSSGLQNDAIEAMVAFANTTGGTVLFGVKNDGTVLGVEVGERTLEDLANRVTQQTYPTLPTHVSQVLVEGRTLVRVDVAHDVPPLVGAYLKSSARLDNDARVRLSELRCLRRVGRTNQQVNLMHLRIASAADPSITFQHGGGTTKGASLPAQWAFKFSNGGPGWAYTVTFRAEHPGARLDVNEGPYDLPPNDQEHVRYKDRPRSGTVRAGDVGPDAGQRPVLLSALCFDSMGLEWRFSVELESQGGQGYILGLRRVAIESFPPKRELAG